jgi:DNA-directed RNA polymerase subunit alpha
MDAQALQKEPTAWEPDYSPEEQQRAEQTRLKKLLDMSVCEIELSVRAANCLRNANITTVGQLAMKTEAELLQLRHYRRRRGRTSSRADSRPL